MDGKLSAPLSTDMRRERLLRIGGPNSPMGATAEEPVSFDTDTSTPSSPTEHTHLQSSFASYGTVLSRHSSVPEPSTPRQLPHRPSLTLLRNALANLPSTPPTLRARALSRLASERPISAYDATLESAKDDDDDVASGVDAKINGIRVWYSSFSSIDWLHDAIKDSVRFARLRRRRNSLRARVQLLIDKSLGWLVVTLVGFFTAIVAFLVVRSERVLFDLKGGYCQTAWWKSKDFCCAEASKILGGPHGARENCLEWRTWAQVFSPGEEGLSADAIQFVSHFSIAVGFSSLIVALR
jgi:chloride channel 3/4/5